MVNIKKTQKLYADAVTQKGNLKKHLANERQRFSIRKLTIGAASVLLGTSLMLGASTQVAHADTNTESNSQPAQVEKTASDSNEKAVVSTDISANQATEQKAASQSEATKQETTNNQKEAKEAVNAQTQNEVAKADAKLEAKVEQKVTTDTQAEIKKEADTSTEKAETAKSTAQASDKKDVATNELTTKVDSAVENGNKTDVSADISKVKAVQDKADLDQKTTPQSTKDVKTTEVQTQTLKVDKTSPISAKALSESKVEDDSQATARLIIDLANTNYDNLHDYDKWGLGRDYLPNNIQTKLNNYAKVHGAVATLNLIKKYVQDPDIQRSLNNFTDFENGKQYDDATIAYNIVHNGLMWVVDDNINQSPYYNQDDPRGVLKTVRDNFPALDGGHDTWPNDLAPIPEDNKNNSILRIPTYAPCMDYTKMEIVDDTTGKVLNTYENVKQAGDPVTFNKKSSQSLKDFIEDTTAPEEPMEISNWNKPDDVLQQIKWYEDHGYKLVSNNYHPFFDVDYAKEHPEYIWALSIGFADTVEQARQYNQDFLQGKPHGTDFEYTRSLTYDDSTYNKDYLPIRKLLDPNYQGKTYISAIRLSSSNGVYGEKDTKKLYRTSMVWAPEAHYYEANLVHDTEEITDTKQVTETINYKYADDSQAAPSYNDVLTFTRTGVKDKTKADSDPDQIQGGEWNIASQTFPDHVSPVIDNYTPDKPIVSSVVVTPDAANVIINVVYNKDKAPSILKFIDDDSNASVLDTDNATGDVGDPISFGKYKDDLTKFTGEGYQVVFDNFNGNGNFVKGGSNYEVHLKHEHVTNTENTSVSRTIYYRGTSNDGKTYENVEGLATSDKPLTQTVTFTRTAIVDKVTGAVGYDTNGDGKVDTTIADKAWVADKDGFDAVKSPDASSKGYDKLDVAVVSAQTGIKPTDKFEPIVVTYSRTPVNADISYWDVTGGKVQLGKTNQDNDEYGRDGEEIHFNNNQNRIVALEKQGYVLVDTDYHAGDKYTKNDSHYNVYFRHAVKEITPDTPVNEIPKDKDGKTIVDPSTLHKEFTRNITFVDDNNHSVVLKDAVSQKVEFNGHIYVNAVTGQTTTPEMGKDVNGKDVQLATVVRGNVEWDNARKSMPAVVQDQIVLAKGDKHVANDNMIGTWNHVHGGADEIALTPDSDNLKDAVLTYTKQAEPAVSVPSKQVVTYIVYDQNGKEIGRFTDTEHNTYTFTGKKVDGKDVWDENTHRYNDIKTPVINGYYADKKEAGQGDATPDHPNVDSTVVYRPLGHLIPTTDTGKNIPGVDHPQYPNDQVDPTKAGKIDIPGIPTWEPEDPSKTDITPNNPGKDTPVPYVQTGYFNVVYIDKDTGKQIDGTAYSAPAQKLGTKITYTVDDTVKELNKQGYELVGDGYTNHVGDVYNNDNKGKVYVVVLQKKAPETKSYNVTVHFVDENGNALQDSRTSGDHKNGTDYNESDHPETLTKDGKTYTYTRVEGDPATGTINGKDVVVTYIYKENETPVTPSEPSTPNEKPSTLNTQSKPSEPTTPNKPSTAKETPSTPSKPSVPSEPAKPVKKTYNKKLIPTHEAFIHTDNGKFQKVDVENHSASNVVLTKNAVPNTAISEHQNNTVPKWDKILPQTGESKTSEAAIFGLIALTLLGIISLAVERRKRN